jgi:hypothetical protein
MDMLISAEKRLLCVGDVDTDSLLENFQLLVHEIFSSTDIDMNEKVDYDEFLPWYENS